MKILIKRIFGFLLTFVMILQLGATVLAADTSEEASYELIAHWDFEVIDTDTTGLKNKVGSGALRATNAPIENGIVTVSMDSGSYLQTEDSCNGDSKDVLFDLANKTIVIKAKIENNGEISPYDALLHRQNSSIAYPSNTPNIVYGEWRIFVISFSVSEDGATVKQSMYMSVNENPLSDEDYLLLGTLDVDGTYIAAKQRISFGKFYNKRNTAEPKCTTYFDDIKIYKGAAEPTQSTPITPDAPEHEPTDALITHWDFEGDSSTALKDKATMGSSDDILTSHGGVTVENGVAYVPVDAGAYMSANGGVGTDIFSFKNKTVVVKAALLNSASGRSVVASFISKENAFSFVLQNHESNNASSMFAVVNNDWNVKAGEPVVMNEFRVFVMTYDYDRQSDSVVCKYYMSNNECPNGINDFTLLVEQKLTNTTNSSVVESAADLILGKRYDHTSKNRSLMAYFDDVKIYDGVISLDTVAAECPSATAYELPIMGGIPNPEVVYEKLNGLSLYAIGDSYFAGHGIGIEYGWPSMLSEKYGMSAVIDAVSGTKLANFKGYEADKIPMALRYKDSLPETAVDIVLIEGGRNDRSVPIPFGTNESRDDTTFKGALNVIIDGVKAKHPNALIICVTTWNAEDKQNPSTTDYAKAMLELCEARGVACINASDPKVSGVDTSDDAFRAKYFLSAEDYSHLNILGGQYVFPYFEENIARLYYEHIGADFVDQTPGEYYYEDTPADTDDIKGPTIPTESDTNAVDTKDTQALTDTDSVDSDNTTDGGVSDGGCGSNLSVSASMILLALAAVAVALTKKRCLNQ